MIHQQTKKKSPTFDVRLLLPVGFENYLHNLSIYLLFDICNFQMFSLLACIFYSGFPNSSVGKESACNAGDLSSIAGSGRLLEKG